MIKKNSRIKKSSKTMNGDGLLTYIEENTAVFDRFTFAYLFKRLLTDGYDNEEAKDVILYSCALSTLVMQERIYNKYYLEMSVNDQLAPDLAELKEEIANKILLDKILKIL